VVWLECRDITFERPAADSLLSVEMDHTDISILQDDFLKTARQAFSQFGIYRTSIYAFGIEAL